MKILLIVLFIVAMVFTSCQTKTEVLPADLTAEKVAVTKALDAHWSAVKAKDADAPDNEDIGKLNKALE